LVVVDLLEPDSSRLLVEVDDGVGDRHLEPVR